MATYQTNAIILKRENVFEADRLYYLYTEDFGLVRAVAGGVRKINAKLTGHLEPFNVVWVELVTKKGGNLSITTALSHGCLLKSRSPNQITLFYQISNFLLKMLKEPQKDNKLWNFIIKGFLNARDVPVGSADAFLNEFKRRVIEILGFGDNWEKAEYYLSDFGVV